MKKLGQVKEAYWIFSQARQIPADEYTHDKAAYIQIALDTLNWVLNNRAASFEMTLQDLQDRIESRIAPGEQKGDNE